MIFEGYHARLVREGLREAKSERVSGILFPVAFEGLLASVIIPAIPAIGLLSLAFLPVALFGGGVLAWNFFANAKTITDVVKCEYKINEEQAKQLVKEYEKAEKLGKENEFSYEIKDTLNEDDILHILAEHSPEPIKRPIFKKENDVRPTRLLRKMVSNNSNKDNDLTL